MLNVVLDFVYVCVCVCVENKVTGIALTKALKILPEAILKGKGKPNYE